MVASRWRAIERTARESDPRRSAHSFERRHLGPDEPTPLTRRGYRGPRRGRRTERRADRVTGGARESARRFAARAEQARRGKRSRRRDEIGSRERSDRRADEAIDQRLGGPDRDEAKRESAKLRRRDVRLPFCDDRKRRAGERDRKPLEAGRGDVNRRPTRPASALKSTARSGHRRSEECTRSDRFAEVERTCLSRRPSRPKAGEEAR